MPVSSKYRRYNNSAKGQARLKSYEKKHPCRYGRSAAYAKLLYHQSQEEAGCHRNPQLFLSGFRLIKALESAEIVEI